MNPVEEHPMNPGQQTYAMYVGIDIAAASASVALMSPDQPARPVFTIEQSEQGITALMAKLAATNHPVSQVRVVMEATGTYWMRLANRLYQAGFAVSVVNASQAYHYAQAWLQRAKTDELDAQTLARLAYQMQPDLWEPDPAVYEELEQRLVERESLLNIRQQLRNQLHALRHRSLVVVAVEARKQALLASIQAQIDAIEREIEDLMRQEHAWISSAQLLRSIKGIGAISAAWLLVATHNFTDCQSPGQLAAYAGLVPYKHESGTSIRRREQIGHAGHARLRHALYMATLSATRHNPAIKVFYDRLRDKGKPMKVARCAAARKLIHMAWAVVTKQTPYDPHYQSNRPTHLQMA
jgi:transposase